MINTTQIMKLDSRSQDDLGTGEGGYNYKMEPSLKN